MDSGWDVCSRFVALQVGAQCCPILLEHDPSQFRTWTPLAYLVLADGRVHNRGLVLLHQVVHRCVEWHRRKDGHRRALRRRQSFVRGVTCAAALNEPDAQAGEEDAESDDRRYTGVQQRCR